jgi:hypothetical protein
MVKYILNIENFEIFGQNLLIITGRYRYDINFNLAKRTGWEFFFS